MTKNKDCRSFVVSELLLSCATKNECASKEIREATKKAKKIYRKYGGIKVNECASMRYFKNSCSSYLASFYGKSAADVILSLKIKKYCK